MIDLDSKIRSLVERNIPRKDIVSELDAIASDAESRAKRFERAKKKGDRYRAESERALSARVGRMLFRPRSTHGLSCRLLITDT